MTAVTDVAAQLQALDPAGYEYATAFVELVLAEARQQRASDVHFQPIPGGLALGWRIDGVLQSLGDFPRGQSADVVARLKVLAHLLTYRTEVPQEGRIPATADCEMRVSTFPTLHGERAVVRLFAGQSQYLYLADLGLPAEIHADLARHLNETSGAVLIGGPAGSGKTTTAYACLREIARQSQGRRSLVSLEDPIEMALDGVAQSQINPAGGFDFPTGLKSLMRQDPEVILVGEVRDAQTALTAFQAALTGHLVISTFHAGSAASGVARLIDMGIEPYLIRSGLRAMLNQRLLRRLCECAQAAAGTRSANAGCAACFQTGYRGRLVLAEMLPPLTGELGQAVLQRRDAVEIHRLAAAAGMTTVFQRARAAAAGGHTDLVEVGRVLGFVADFGVGSE